MRRLITEDFKPQPYWWDAALPQDTRDAELPRQIDFLIVGAGYCGLCCALELAEYDASVAVIDADNLGSGASTRSGGMVTGGQKFVVSGAIRGVTQEKTAQMLAAARDSLTVFGQRIEKYGLDAMYQRTGRIILAATSRHYQKLEKWAELLREQTNADTSLLQGDGLRAEVPGSRYAGGLLIPEYGGVHPAKYHQALRRAAAAKGVTLHSHAAATSIKPEGGGFRVDTRRGTIRARQVFVATNAYADGLLPFLRRRVIPVSSYIIATEPLSREAMDHYFPKRRMLSDTRKDLAYFRPSPDGTRILYGARPNLCDTDERTAAGQLHDQMCRIWPEAADLRVSHCWTGNVGMTVDRLPHTGTIDGIHYATACNGSGVAMMSYLGTQSARKMLGMNDHCIAFENLKFVAAPMYNGYPWFVPVAASWYRAKDALDELLG